LLVLAGETRTVGAVAMAMLGTLPAADRIPLDIARPVFTMPEFSWQAVVELVVPLTITVMVVQNGQGFAVLSAAGHKPPINVIATVCGIGALLVSTAGTVSTCLTGPVSGIIVAEGRKEGHYAAGVLVALLAVLFGLMAPMFTGVMLATPRAFISTLAGIALLRVLLGAFTTAFQGPCAIGALVAFTVTVSNLSIYNIGAPFWGLVLGFAASWLVERKDFPRPDAA
ncbi:MAG: benzoate/H(+) symporter BenE family transporter, partial [Rhodospirillaceae bacterium]